MVASGAGLPAIVLKEAARGYFRAHQAHLYSMETSVTVAGEEPRQRRRGPMPTPSPLRRMADPSADHIMPSRKERKSSSMAPPPPRPRSKVPQPGSLDEDTFVEALGEIIERDFFPDLPKLHRQLKWLEGLESRKVPNVTEVRRVVMSEQRRFGQESSSVPSSAGATPLLGGGTPLVGGGGVGAGGASASRAQEEERQTLVPPNLTLDKFLAQYRSEDDASFEDLAVKMREAHKRKYWWVYENKAIEAGKESLYLLTSGEMMTDEERKKRDEACNAKPRRGDDRPNGPEGWTYRAKNHLIFQPELQETMKVNKVAEDGLLLLGNGTATTSGGGGALVISSNPRVGDAAKAPKAVVHKNTRFVPGDGAGSGGLVLASPIERLRTDLTNLSSDTSASAEARANNEGFVPMTPAIIPGAGGQSPFITWGEIEGTPLRVAEPFERSGDLSIPSSSSAAAQSRGFKMQGPSYREKLATSLETSARRRGGSATPKVYSEKRDSRGGTKGSLPTPGSVNRTLTPAAKSLAQKLAAAQAGGAGGDVFGGAVSSELRASYSRGGGVAGSSVSLGKRPGGGPTPSPSPMRIAPSSKRSKEGGGGGSGSGGGGTQGGGGGANKKLTANLLDI